MLLIRMHHLITKIKGLDTAQGFALNVSNYDDVQELSLIADILITDYSSVFFDYAVSGKPILFYAYDLEEYAEKLRGFYIDMHTDLPGPVIQEETKLIESIVHIDKVTQDYKERYTFFKEKFCYLDNGHATQTVVENVFKELHE